MHRRRWLAIVGGLVAFSWPAPLPAAEPKPLPSAHAHNDYAHKRPLLDALDHGFCNVEADIFLVRDQLLVGHTVLDLNPERTLQKLYLDPLRDRVKANGGRVYRDGPGFTLMIDLKTDAEPTYAALKKSLENYHDMLTAIRDGKVESRGVQIVLSGNRPAKTVAAEKLRHVALDGRLSDLKSDAPDHLIPWISDNWRNHFTWRGTGPFPEAERQKLQDFVTQAHANKRKLRFWATPDRPEAWQALRTAGVDLINTDDLPGLRKFLK